MFELERPQVGERAVVVHVGLASSTDEDGRVDEFVQLATSAGVEPVAVITGTRRTPDPKTFVGPGKLEEIRACVVQEAAEVVLFDHALSPSQERNLERSLGCRVLDRTTLILDIFAQRARSFEGKLQVELAQLRHLSTRLVRGWTHLERQKGGIGLRGPGETQLETDRRLVADRIRMLTKRLERVSRQRGQGRRARQRADVPTVSLVGYTNAGKSTLFNQLTEAHVLAENRLFATLDPTLRRWPVSDRETVVLADTVGFIRDLPHDLVAAFRSTLEETREADLLLHVIDAGAERRDECREQVDGVLREIRADRVPRIEVFNKIDCIDAAPRVDRDADGRPVRVWVSAETGAGLDELAAAVAERLRPESVEGWVCLPPQAGRLRAKLFAAGAVDEERIGRDGQCWLSVRLPRRRFDGLDKEEGLLRYWAGPPERAAVAGACQPA